MEHWQDAYGRAKDLGDLWRLEKNGRQAICVLVGHPLGQEVRVTVDGDFKRSAVFKDSKEMIDTMDEWRRLFEANGWIKSS